MVNYGKVYTQKALAVMNAVALPRPSLDCVYAATCSSRSNQSMRRNVQSDG